MVQQFANISSADLIFFDEKTNCIGKVMKTRLNTFWSYAGLFMAMEMLVNGVPFSTRNVFPTSSGLTI
jgi:hypothetical protein